MIERVISTFFVAWFTLAILISLIYPMLHEQPKLPEVAIIEIKKVNVNHAKCLATGIYYESKGEPLLGQVAVARVIMNRVLHGFGKDPCAVVYQTATRTDEEGQRVKLCQFSWVCDGKSTPADNNPKYKKALDIANQVLAEDKWREVLPNNTLFFHNLSAAPGWTYKQVTTIGNHIFYSKGKEKKINVASE